MILYLKKIIRKFTYAFTGIFHGITHDFSIRLQFILGIITIVAGMLLSFTKVEWITTSIMISLVITLEFVNSSLEHIVDFISPEFHREAKIIKDYSAAAVLCISIGALIVACIIIGGKLL